MESCSFCTFSRSARRRFCFPWLAVSASSRSAPLAAKLACIPERSWCSHWYQFVGLTFATLCLLRSRGRCTVAQLAHGYYHLAERWSPRFLSPFCSFIVCGCCFLCYFRKALILAGWFGLEPISRLTRSFFTFIEEVVVSSACGKGSLTFLPGWGLYGVAHYRGKVENPKVSTIFFLDLLTNQWFSLQ